MNVELTQEELNLLIECVTESKGRILDMLENEWDDDFLYLPDVSELTNELNNIYSIKTKLCNYSIQFQEEN